jgi:CPA2 family monovalent cation:H+ antiporter-2
MPHETTLIAMIASAFVLAFALGFLASKLRLPPLVGYLFAVLFFVSVGMLFDPKIIVREPLAVASVVLVIVTGKSIAAFLIVLAFRHPLRTALTVSASLAQIGEFSFILASLGLSLGLLPPVGRDLILAGALLSITLNPFAFAALSLIERTALRVR